MDIYSWHLKELQICFLWFFGIGHGINNSSEQADEVVVLVGVLFVCFLPNVVQVMKGV